MSTSSNIVELIDINKIYDCMAVIPKDHLAQFSVGEGYVAQVHALDDRTNAPKFFVYPVLEDGTVDISQHLLSIDTIDDEVADDAYRNTLTCEFCAAERDICECAEGKAERAKQYREFNISHCPF